jgi:hypothetical protein
LPLTTDVLFADKLSPEEANGLVQNFETVGMTATLREVPPRRSLDDIAWLVLAAVPLKPFFEQLAQDFATDAYKRLATLVGKIFHGRLSQATESPRVFLLQDSETGVQIVIEPDLPDESYQQLVTLDLSTIRHGPVHYDRHQHRWRSELDEAAQPAPTRT